MQIICTFGNVGKIIRSLQQQLGLNPLPVGYGVPFDLPGLPGNPIGRDLNFDRVKAL